MVYFQQPFDSQSSTDYFNVFFKMEEDFHERHRNPDRWHSPSDSIRMYHPPRRAYNRYQLNVRTLIIRVSQFTITIRRTTIVITRRVTVARITVAITIDVLYAGHI